MEFKKQFQCVIYDQIKVTFYNLQKENLHY